MRSHQRKNLRSILLALLAATTLTVSAQEFMPDDRIARDIRRLFLLSGRVFPISRYPVSRSALAAAAESLPEPYRAQALEAMATRTGDLPPAGAVIRGAFEAAYDVGLSSSGLRIEDGARPGNGIDMQRSYVNEPAPVRFGGTAETSTGLFVAAAGQFKREWQGDFAKVDNLPAFGGQGDPVALDNHFFTRGVLAWSSGETRAAIGRDRLHFGAGQGSTLLHSKDLPYLDALSFTVPIGRIRLDWVVSTISSERALGVDVDTYCAPTPTNKYNDPVWNGTKNEFDLGYFGFEKSLNPTTIIYNVHRFEWIGERLRMGLAGQVMLARRNNMFTVTDFLPISTWHNARVFPNNMCMVFEASFTAVPGLAIHAQAGFDDISAEIFGLSDSQVPTVDAYLLSAEFAFAAGRLAFDGFLEGGYTHYLWGNYDGYETAGEDRGVLARFIGRYKSDRGAILLPLSSPFGPGAAWVKGALSARPSGSEATFGMEFLVLSKNTAADLVSTDFVRDAAVANAARRLAIEIAGTAGVEFGSVRVSLRPALLTLDGALDASLGISFAYRFGDKLALSGK